MRPLAATLAAAAALALAACPAAPPPGPAPTPALLSTPKPAGTPKVTPEPAPSRWRSAAVVGWAYHPDGKLVGPGHVLRVHTGPAARAPFDQSTALADGGYGLIGVPSQADLAFDVLREGAVVASRGVRFSGLEARPVVSFGGPATAEDPKAPEHPVPTATPPAP